MKCLKKICSKFYLNHCLIILAFFIHFDVRGQVDSVANSENTRFQSLEQTPETLEDYLYLAKTFNIKAPKKSLELSLQAIKYAKKIENPASIAKSYKSAGVAAYYLSQIDVAIPYYDSALVLFSQIPDSIEMAKLYNNYGVLYSDFGQYVKAIEYYNKALQINSLIGNKESIGRNNNNIGAMYYKLNAYDKSASYFKTAYTIAEELNDEPSMLTSRNNLGLISHAEGNYIEAIELFDDCITIGKKLNDSVGMGNAHLNIGNIYLETGQVDSAFFHLIKSLKIFEQLDRPHARSWLGIGKTHLLNNNNRQALNAFLKAEEDFTYFPDNELRIKVLKELYKSWDALGNQAEAFKVLKTYHSLFDSVKELFDSTAVANLQARFEVEKKVDEVTTLKKEHVAQTKILDEQKEKNKLDKILLYFSYLTLFILLVALLLYFKLYKKHKKINQLLQGQNKLLEQARDELALSNSIIAEHEERLSLLINALPDIICFKDGFGRWLIANQSDLELFNLVGIDYKGKTDIDLIPFSPSNDIAFRACVVSDEEAWQQRKITRSDETIVDPLGKERVFDVIKIPLFQPDGNRKALIVIGRDITERKLTELKLSNALKNAEESDKLKSSFLSNMSHEIRTPLNAVIGFSELLEDENLTKETTRKYVKHIKENGSALLTLIADILELSRIESGVFSIQEEPLNLNELFKEFYPNFLQLSYQKGKKHLRIISNIPSNDVIIQSDKQRIRQIMINLFDNALKFTGEGSIEFGFKIIYDSDNKSMIEIMMKDTGIGIPILKQHLLFKRFTKIHESSGMVYPGAGLGLSIVNQIVTRMGGNIKVLSEAGSGTSVIFSLPYLPAFITEAEFVHKNELSKDLKGKKVLVVEDVDSNYDLLKVILETSGMIVYRAIEGYRAIEICHEISDLDLVLMDIQLPGLNGHEATKAIKKFRPYLPVIAQTAFAMADEKDACFTAGCDGYIAKPIKAQLLMPVLYQVLNKDGFQ